MKSEQSLIETLSRIHGTRPFGADAEVVPFEGTNLLVSTDSFSAREDFLSALEPEAMGRVMAYGAISDILTCGAKPEFLVQAWNVDASHDEQFYERVAQGVQQVVSHYGAKVVGGDIGSAKEWCWTATVFASCKTPVCRIASQHIDFDLYTTGPLGAANAAVFLGRAIPEPQLRAPVPSSALFATRWRTSAASITGCGLSWMRSAPFRRKSRGGFRPAWRRGGRSSAELANTSFCLQFPPERLSPMP